MSGWGYLVLLVVFTVLSFGMRFLLLRRGSGKIAGGGNDKRDRRQNG
ncbi:MAG: hypothetical protein DDT21_01319 [Syntrophomonadaceae bacterium]|nr:hypothetical protein [Bacillota bacterium]